MRSWNWIAGCLCAAVVLIDSIACPVAIRTVIVLSFAAWVPGALVLGLLDRTRGEVRPGLPAVALSLSILILATCLPLEFHLFPTRGGFVVFAAVCGGLIVAREILEHRRHGAAR